MALDGTGSVRRYWLVLGVLGHYKLVLLSTWWCRVSIGHLCLYILKMWRFGQVFPIPHSQTHSQTKPFVTILRFYMYIFLRYKKTLNCFNTLHTLLTLPAKRHTYMAYDTFIAIRLKHYADETDGS